MSRIFFFCKIQNNSKDPHAIISPTISIDSPSGESIFNQVSVILESLRSGALSSQSSLKASVQGAEV